MFDLECINLLCNLESLMADFREKPIGERMEAASQMAAEIVVKLIDFSDENFDSQQAAGLMQNVDQTLACRKQHEAALKQRSWTYTFKSLISSKAIDPRTIEAYDKLGKSLIFVCGFVLTEMLRSVRSDSMVRSQLNQSSIAFLEELKGAWL